MFTYKESIIISVDGIDCSGKQQPISEPVLTPDGWKSIGDLKIGSKVIGSNGLAVNVTAIYPQTDKRVFSVYFKDGSVVRCGADHLWKVYTLKQRTRNYSHNKDNHFVKTTYELLTEIERSCPKNNRRYKFAIPQYVPIVEGTHFKHAYALGYMLGNGCFSQGQLAISCHVGVKEELKKLLLRSCGVPTNEHYTSERGVQLKYSWYKLPNELVVYRNTGLSHSKNIIQDWTMWNLESKKNLLAGLLDSDGSVCRNIVQFVSTNINLITLVQNLTRNVGQTAYQILQSDQRNYYKSGSCFNINLKFDYNPFKIRTWIPRKDRRYLPLITKIEQENYQEESVCIELDSKDKLYTTTDYKLTHNSSLLNDIKAEYKNRNYNVKIFKDFTDNSEFNTKQYIETIRSLVLNSDKEYLDINNHLLLITLGRLEMIKDIQLYIELNKNTSKPLIILLDRYVQSTLAYQLSMGADKDLTNYLCKHACNLLKPDLSILLDINYETYKHRINRRGKDIDKYEEDLNEKFNTIRDAFVNEFLNQNINYSSQYLIVDNNKFEAAYKIIETVNKLI